MPLLDLPQLWALMYTISLSFSFWRVDKISMPARLNVINWASVIVEAPETSGIDILLKLRDINGMVFVDDIPLHLLSPLFKILYIYRAEKLSADFPARTLQISQFLIRSARSDSPVII